MKIGDKITTPRGAGKITQVNTAGTAALVETGEGETFDASWYSEDDLTKPRRAAKKTEPAPPADPQVWRAKVTLEDGRNAVAFLPADRDVDRDAALEEFSEWFDERGDVDALDELDQVSATVFTETLPEGWVTLGTHGEGE